MVVSFAPVLNYEQQRVNEQHCDKFFDPLQQQQQHYQQQQQQQKQQAHLTPVSARASTGPALERIKSLANLNANQSQPALSFGAIAAADMECALSAADSMLGESFSFNSYQDILCSSSEGSTSTFSASDVQRSLRLQRERASGCSNNEQVRLHDLHSKQQNQNKKHQPLYSAKSSTSKFRVHSRQKSVGGSSLEFQLKQLTRPDNNEDCKQYQQIDSVVNLRPNSKEQEQAKKHQWHEEKQVETIVRAKNNQRQQQDYESSFVKQEQVHHKSQLQYDKVPNDKNKGKNRSKLRSNNSNKNRNKTMSHSTLQSIQSLSMQLNQQVNLRTASSSMSELSQLSASISSSPLTRQQHSQQQLSLTNNMAPQNKTPSSSGKLSRLVGKKAARVKELFLQNLGKADKTTDDLFQMYEENFYKQQAQAIKLQKEFKQYVGALKVAHESSKSLNVCIQQSTSDYQSARHDLVCENLSQLEHLNEDLMEKLRTQILISMTEYLAQFDELKEKIAKRKRKLIDHDSSRRIYEIMLAAVTKKRQQLTNQRQQQNNNNTINTQQNQTNPSRSFRSAFKLGGNAANESNSIQSATNQLVDEARLLKLREQYNYCKIKFDTINQELYEQLPMLYEKKMKHLLMSLQSYFSLEAQFHSNAGKLYATASDVIDELPSSSASSSSFNTSRPHHNIRNHHSNHHAGRESVGTGSVEEEEDEDEVDEEEEEEDEQADQHNEEQEEHYNEKNNVPISGASSGVGSSRCGDSSIESSSTSPAAEVEETTASDVDEQDIGREEEKQPLEIVGVSQKSDTESHKEDTSTEAGKLKHTVSGGEQVASAQGSSNDVQSNATSKVVEDTKNNITEAGDKSVEQTKHSSLDKAPSVTESTSDGKVESEDKLEGLQHTASEEVDVHKRNEQKADCFLYKVKTSYKYLAEDVDELCFEADEIIQVIEFDPAQEQEEGWLMGIREVNGQRGLFPANFTQPL